MVVNQKRAGVILSYISIFLNIIISLLYSPIMLRILGQNEYGIYSIATSTISCLSLLSLGLNGSYLKFYSAAKQKNGGNDVKTLNGLYLFVFSIIGIIALIIGFIFSGNISLFFNETYSAADLKTAKILFAILSINIAISFPASVFSSYITSQEKFVFLKVVNLISMVASPCVNIILLYLGFASVGMVATTTGITILVLIINAIYCFKKLKMKITFKNLDFSLFKKILFFSLFISMNQIIELINLQTDKIILGKMIGGSVVAVYAVGSHINSLFTNFSTAVSSVFAPKINMLVEEKRPNLDEELTDLFIKVGRVQWFTLLLIFTGFVFFGQFFISIWAGEGYENAYYVALLLMAPALVALIQNAGVEIQRAKNKHHVRSIVYLVIAFINVGVSIILAKYLAEIGCALGTTISLVLGPILFMNFYYHKKLNINMIKFWKEIIKTLPGFIIPIVLGLAISLFHPFHNFWDFFAIVVLYTIVYCTSVYFISLNKNEKFICTNFIKKIFKNKKGKQNENI